MGTIPEIANTIKSATILLVYSGLMCYLFIFSGILIDSRPRMTFIALLIIAVARTAISIIFLTSSWLE